MPTSKNGKQSAAEERSVETPIETGKPNLSPDDFHIVGIGASAGGLDAFAKFLTATPEDTGMAYVLIQHLDPSHASNMVDLLRRYTKMPVQEATDEVKLERNHVYMIPPNRNMTIEDHNLKLLQQIDRPVYRPFYRPFLQIPGSRPQGQSHLHHHVWHRHGRDAGGEGGQGRTGHGHGPEPGGSVL